MIRKQEGQCKCSMAACDFFKAAKLARKARVKLRITEKKGLPFFLKRSRKRLAFYMGLIFCTAFLYGSSLFIWDISFEGNMKYTDGTLLKFLETCGYVHGMKKEGIFCEEIEKEIRNHYNDITWVSAEITGNRLIIRIKENKILEASSEEASEKTGDITAKRGGTILSMITREGTPAVHVGDVVEPGQLLISGTLEIKDEGGNLLKTESVRADGDVTAATSYVYEDTFSMIYSQKYYTGEQIERHYFWLFGKRFSFPGKKNSYVSYDEIDSCSQVHLWENFYLPVGWGTITVREYKNTDAIYSKEAARQQAEKRFQIYCENLKASGAEIEKADIQVTSDTDTCKVTGTIWAKEEIAQAGE